MIVVMSSIEWIRYTYETLNKVVILVLLFSQHDLKFVLTSDIEVTIKAADYLW